MDVGSRPLYRRDLERSDGGGRRAAIWVVGIAVVILCLVALLGAILASLPPAPASEPELLAPFRWSTRVRWA